MPRTRLIVHVAEPFDFGRRNAGESDLTGWTTQANPSNPDWVVYLDRPAVIDEEEFDRVKISSATRETVSKVLEGFGFTAVNICYPRLDENGRTYWHFGMVGNVLLAPEDK